MISTVTTAAPSSDRFCLSSRDAGGSVGSWGISNVETALIGALIKDPARVLALCRERGLDAESLDNPDHKLVFTTIAGMNPDAVDIPLVQIALARAGRLDIDLPTLVDACTTPAHAAYHADAVAAAARYRRLAALGQNLAAAGGTGDLEAIERTIADIREAATVPAMTNGSPPAIVKATDFIESPIPRPPEVIHGVLHRGSKLVYGGPSKAFKSWTLIDLCLAVATGGTWFDFQTTAGLVLYVNLELQPFAIQDRLQAIAAARGCAVPAGLRLWNLRGRSTSLVDLLPDLLRQVAGEGYALIVPDPIYKCLGGRDENSAGDMGAMMAELEAVAVETGAAVAFGAHFAKGNASGKEHIDRVSGSGVFARDPDTIVTASPHEDDSAFSVEMTCRNFAPPAPFVIRWDYPCMTRDDSADPTRLRKARRPGAGGDRPNVETLIAEAVALVNVKPMNIGQFRGKLYKLAGTQERVRGLFHVLVGDGHLAEIHERARGTHTAMIGTPAVIAAYRQRKLDV